MSSGGLPARLAVKDLELVREVAESGRVEMPPRDTVLERMSDVARTHGG